MGVLANRPNGRGGDRKIHQFIWDSNSAEQVTILSLVMVLPKGWVGRPIGRPTLLASPSFVLAPWGRLLGAPPPSLSSGAGGGAALLELRWVVCVCAHCSREPT